MGLACWGLQGAGRHSRDWGAKGEGAVVGVQKGHAQHPETGLRQLVPGGVGGSWWGDRLRECGRCRQAHLERPDHHHGLACAGHKAQLDLRLHLRLMRHLGGCKRTWCGEAVR